MTTMREVAERAEVSVATVSRVINNVGYVSPDLKDRVMGAMRALHYQPSALARSLRRQETRTIGVLIPQIDQPFFAALAYAVEKELFDNDYRMLLCSAQEDHDKEMAYAEILVRQRVDGLIVVPTGRSSDLFDLFDQRDVPIVLVDRDIADVKASRVLVDNLQGGYTGMAHLLDLGHRDIRIIGAPAYSRALQQRSDGAHKALQDYGVNGDGELLVAGTLQPYEMGYKTALELLRQTPRPTAIFALTDVIAVGVMHAAAKLGLRLPQDLSVVGFDDIPLAGFMIPSLTTVAQPIYEMGAHAARLLLEHIAEPETAAHETVQFETRLMVRDSSVRLQEEKR
jgi:LacI family transcriptional regulator